MITNRIQQHDRRSNEDIRQGKIIIVVDDEDRENEGDFLQRKVTRNDQLHGNSRTWIDCAPLTESRCKELGLRHGQ
jgi:3,4-dihydroxy 2-butanone 4-phosphate synthase/GTP cyclohydrolase II